MRCEKVYASVYPATNPKPEAPLSVDLATVKRVARLARIAVSEEDAGRMTGELNAILGFVQQLDEVDITGVEPMTSVIPLALRRREDVVNDGAKAEDIVANATGSEENFFVVPKVIE
jgi:aspartyl-tRNA(Asn)/glutamyl-tRNA(Gln) amidotransferase subunit C